MKGSLNSQPAFWLVPTGSGWEFRLGEGLKLSFWWEETSSSDDCTSSACASYLQLTAIWCEVGNVGCHWTDHEIIDNKWFGIKCGARWEIGSCTRNSTGKNKTNKQTKKNKIHINRISVANCIVLMVGEAWQSPHVRESGIQQIFAVGIRNPLWYGFQNPESRGWNPGPSWILLHGATGRAARWVTEWI